MNSYVLRFIAITFAICWVAAGAFYLTGMVYQGVAGVVFAASYMLVPGLVAIFLDWRHDRGLPGSLWMKLQPNRWWALAWIAPILLAFAGLAGALLVPGVSLDAGMGGLLDSMEGLLTPEQMEEGLQELERYPLWLMIPLLVGQAMIAGATINALFALGEELGWRALMLRELLAKGFWTSALIIGVVWGLWHAPLILQGHNYPEHPLVGVLMMVGFCVLWSPLFSWVTLRSKSVLAAAVMHGTINASAAFSVLWLSDIVPLVTGLTGLVGFGLLVAVNLLLFVFARPHHSQFQWALDTAVVKE